MIFLDPKFLCFHYKKAKQKMYYVRNSGPDGKKIVQQDHMVKVFQAVIADIKTLKDDSEMLNSIINLVNLFNAVKCQRFDL